MSTDTLTVSVIIRNRNEAEYLPHVFEAIAGQDTPALEIIFIDNESTDNSNEIASKYGAKILNIKKDDFTYGKALNMGIQEAKGDLCLILSAHALPMGNSFISECIKPFSNPNVAAARTTYAGKKADIFNWLYPEILNSETDLKTVNKKGPLGSGCVIRRDIWLINPFNEITKSAEDKIWAIEVLKKGYTIHASVGAIYTYIKPFTKLKQLKNDYRDGLAFYKYTGIKNGFIDKSIPQAITTFLYALTIVAPLSALEVIKLGFFRAVYAIRLRRDSKK